MAKVLVFANHKGGTGKTVSSWVTSGILQAPPYNKKVLFVDADPQCNSSRCYKADLSDGVATLYDLVIAHDASIYECIQHTEQGDIIPSDPLLVEFNSMDSKQVLALRPLFKEIDKEYDYIICDIGPAAWESVAKCCLCAADCVVVCACPTQMAGEGMVELWDMIRAIRDGLNSQLHIAGVLITLYKRRRISLNNIEIIKNLICPRLETTLFSRPIRDCVSVEESVSYRIPLLKYAPYSTAAMDYIHFVEEFLDREDN